MDNNKAINPPIIAKGRAIIINKGIITDSYRLATAYEIKKLKQRKIAKNKKYLSNGKSSTYFVLRDEEDLDEIEVNIFQCILELISVYEQAQIFYGHSNVLDLDNI